MFTKTSFSLHYFLSITPPALALPSLRLLLVIFLSVLIRLGTSSSKMPFSGTTTTPFSTTTTSPFNNAVTGVTTAAIVSAIFGTIGTVVIVILLIRCLNKATKRNMPYAHFEIGNVRKPISNPTSPGFSVVPDPPISNPTPPGFFVAPEPHIEATMKRFFSNIAKEKPTMFSAQELSVFSQNYNTRLGSGGFGIVYKGEFPNGVPVAIKVLNKTSETQAKEQFMAEVSTVGRTYHVNLVRLYGFCFDSTVQALVYEYMDKGSLDGLLYDRNQRIEWVKLNEIAIGTAKGIAYLHEDCHQRIIHYDIKPGNVLLDAELFPKVADFGLAKLSNRDSTHISMTNYRGTPGYAAPELYMPYPVTHKCDVYSFGMLLFEIVGRRRNHNPNLSEPEDWLPRWAWEMFEKGQLSELLEQLGIEEKHREKAERMSVVALWCVQYLPESRPLMSNVVKMLGGGIEIKSPPNPFQHLVSATQNLTTTISESDSSVSIE